MNGFKIPSSVRILGRTFKVTLLEDAGNPELDRKYNGRIKFNEQEIFLYKGDRTEYALSHDFLHELKHAIDDSLHIKYPSPDVEEKEVECFATAYLLIQEALNTEERRKLSAPNGI